MTDRQALLAAVCANPDDDTPRLVFADWLEENGEPERAEFIRLQVEQADVSRTSARRVELAGKRMRELWDQYGAKWRLELPGIDGVFWHDAFFRGFVERAVVATDGLLVQHRSTIFNNAPLRHLVIQRFEAAVGFAALRGLARLQTLSVTNLQATESIVRGLIECDQLSESALLFCHFGALDTQFYSELRAKFGARLFRPHPPQPRIVGQTYRSDRKR